MPLIESATTYILDMLLQNKEFKFRYRGVRQWMCHR